VLKQNYNDVKIHSKGGRNMRKTYIDNVRWITVTLVVIYHVIYMFNGVSLYGVIGPFSDHQPQDMYQYIVYPWFMVLLFTISGMSARYYLQDHTDREFVRTRTNKLLVPSTLGVLAFGWIMGYYNMLVSGAFDNPLPVPAPVRYLIMCVSGTGVLWFVQLLWVYCILLVLVRKIEKDRFYELCKSSNCIVLAALTLLIWGAAQVLNTPMIVVYRIGIYGAAFFIGYFVLSHDEVMERLGSRWIVFTVAAAASGIAFVATFWQREPYTEHVVLDTLLCNVYAWMVTLGILAFMKRWGGFENRLSDWMSKKSWGLYVFHYLFIAIPAWYLHVYALDMPPVFVYLLVAISGFCGAFAFYEIVRRIPVVRWLMLGIRKESKG